MTVWKPHATVAAIAERYSLDMLDHLSADIG